MKIGVVVIFRDNEKDIDKGFFVKKLSHIKNMEFCFVNNSSKDQTLPLLRRIKNESIAPISILDIKKYKSKQFASRAGARYLLSFFDLEYIGYLDISALKNKYKTISELIKLVNTNDSYSSSNY